MSDTWMELRSAAEACGAAKARVLSDPTADHARALGDAIGTLWKIADADYILALLDALDHLTSDNKRMGELEGAARKFLAAYEATRASDMADRFDWAASAKRNAAEQEALSQFRAALTSKEGEDE